MFNAIVLYFKYQSNYVVSFKIVTTDLNLLFCILRKDKSKDNQHKSDAIYL